jgi:predicted nucleic acid-binding protein
MKIVVDTDVASLIHKDRLPPQLDAQLRGRQLCLSFVTIGELTRWMEQYHWGSRNRAKLGAWMTHVAELG